MESERRLLFPFFKLLQPSAWSALGWVTCICLQETIRKNEACTLAVVRAEVHPFPLGWECPETRSAPVERLPVSLNQLFLYRTVIGTIAERPYK